MFTRKGTYASKRRRSKRLQRRSLPVTGSTMTNIPTVVLRYKSESEAGEMMTSPIASSPSSRRTSSQARPSIYDTFVQLKVHEDEKSLCQSDWSRELSLDQSQTSVFIQIQEVNIESENMWEFLVKSLNIMGNTLLMTFFLGMFASLPTAMISIGIKYMYECPVQPRLPVYHIVGGCFGLLKVLSLMWRQARHRRSQSYDDVESIAENDVITSKSSKFSEGILSLFLFCWFIAGNVWLLSIWNPNFEQLLHEPSNWCSKTVFLFTLAQIATCYCMMACVMLVSLILICCRRNCMEQP